MGKLDDESIVNSGLEYFTALFRVSLPFICSLMKEVVFSIGLHEHIHHIQGLKS